MIRYILISGEGESGRIIDLLAESLPNERGEIMTIAQQLKNEGMQQGMQQRECEIARTMLKEGDSPNRVARITSLPLHDIEQLQQDL